MANAKLDQNSRPTLTALSSANDGTIVAVWADPVTHRLLVDSAGGSGGTVTDVSVVTANGFAGTVANSTTTPAITLSTTVTGILQGNGTAISAASTTGSGSVVLQTSPTLITPNIGVATGTSLSVSGILRSETSLVLEETGAGTDTITIQAPASIAASYTLTLPIDNGTPNQLLSTDGDGVLSWVSPSGFNLTVGAVANVDTILFSGATVTDDTGGQVTVTIDVQDTVTVASETTDTSCYTAFFTAETGDLQPKTNPNFIFNSNTNSLGLGGAPTEILHLIKATGNFTTARFDSGTTQGYFYAEDGGNTVAFGSNSNASVVFRVNNASETILTSTAFSPAADGGNSLGTTSLGWQNLFGNTGFVWNIENGDWVATHTAGILTVGTGDLRVTNNFTNAASVVTVGGAQTLTNKTLTSPIINTGSYGGIQTLNEGASIGLDVSLADTMWTGISIPGTAGATLAFGDVVYLAVADSRWELADASAVSTAAQMTGICILAAASDGDPTRILLTGTVRADTAFPTLTVGAPVFLSETAGDVTNTAPTTTDSVTRVLGYGIDGNTMYWNPSNDWITHV